MNERIKELAEQAGLIQWEISPWNPFVKIPDHESVVKAKKFAELLVQDVLKVINEVGYKSSNDIPFSTTELFERMVKQHFEVE